MNFAPGDDGKRIPRGGLIEQPHARSIG